MRALRVLAAAFVVFGVLPAAAQEAGRTFGQALESPGQDEVKIAALVASPDQFTRTSVRVSGVVVEVCPESRDWIEIANDADGAKVRVFLSDRSTFPKDAKGNRATAEGVLTRVEVTPEDAKRLPKILVVDPTQDVAPGVTTVGKAPEVETMYVLQATGVVLE